MEKNAARPLALAAIAGTVLMVVLVIFLVFRTPAEEPPASSPPEASALSSGTADPAGAESVSAVSGPMLCVLGVWEGKLARFWPDGLSPQEVYDVYVVSLPEEEQRRLEEGIPVYDDRTLAGLLEDYTS